MLVENMDRLYEIWIADKISKRNIKQDRSDSMNMVGLEIWSMTKNKSIQFLNDADKAERLKANSKLTQTFHMNEQLQQDILQELELTFNNWLMLKASINAHKTLLNSAKLKLKTVRYSYQNGSRTLNDLLNATTDLYQSKISYNNSIYRYILSGLKLKLLSGTLSKEDLATIDDWFAN